MTRTPLALAAADLDAAFQLARASASLTAVLAIADRADATARDHPEQMALRGIAIAIHALADVARHRDVDALSERWLRVDAAVHLVATLRHADRVAQRSSANDAA